MERERDSGGEIKDRLRQKGRGRLKRRSRDGDRLTARARGKSDAESLGLRA